MMNQQPKPKLKPMPPDDADGAIINTKIAGTELIGHRSGNKMLRSLVYVNLKWLAERNDGADLYRKMLSIYQALLDNGYNFCNLPDSFNFEDASLSRAVLSIRKEKDFLFEKSKDGETLTLDEDLELLKEKLPASFLKQFQNEFKGNYTTQLHSSHDMSISFFQMDESGELTL